MTGGFSTTIRGIEIDVVATLNKFLEQNKKSYTLKEFEEYLKKFGLDDNFRYDTGQNDPINNGFVATIDYEESPEQDAVGYLATGLSEYQYWVFQEWDEKSLKIQQNFLDIKHLSDEIENNLRELWKDKLILKKKIKVVTIGCEWSHTFFPKSVTKGGTINYYNKYLKYKNKYSLLV